MIGDNYAADVTGAAALDIPGILVRKHHPDAVIACESLHHVMTIVSASPERKPQCVSGRYAV
jgi:ribonucleotide monophosphatase NagD (HAD superfamily)